MEPAVRSVSGPAIWGVAEILQVVGVVGLVAVLVGYGIVAMRSGEGDPREDPSLRELTAARRRRRKPWTLDDPDEQRERDKHWGPVGGPPGGDGSG